jgi:hypothetical protein
LLWPERVPFVYTGGSRFLGFEIYADIRLAAEGRPVRFAVPFRPRKKKFRQSKFHRCSRCGGQVRRRTVRCKKCAEPQKHK